MSRQTEAQTFVPTCPTTVYGFEQADMQPMLALAPSLLSICVAFKAPLQNSKELGDSADRSMLGDLLSRLGLQFRTICLQKVLLLLSQLSVKSLEL